MSVLFEMRGEFDQAADNLNKSSQVFAKLWSADPTDVLARDNLALSELDFGEILLHSGSAEASIPPLRKGVASLEAIQHENRLESAGLADGDSLLGRAYLALADRDEPPGKKRKQLLEARSWFQKSLQASQPNSDSAIVGSSSAIGDNETKRELARCNAALARLQSSNQPEGVSTAIHP